MKNIIIANTFTPLYDELEDRIRVVINYQEMKNRVDFMITRSFILNLVPTAEEFIYEHYKREPVVEEYITIGFQEKSSQDEVVSKTDSVNLELFRTKEELLLEVNFSYDATTKQTAVIFTSKNVIAKSNLDAPTMQQIFKLIKSAIPNIKWGIAHHF